MKQVHGTTKNNLVKPLATAIALSTMLFSVNASAGAWVGAEGTGYVKIGASTYDSNDTHDASPTFIDFESVGASIYAEYGLGNDFSIFGSLLYQDYEQRDSAVGLTVTDGFGDAEFGVRYQWQADPFVLSTSFLVKSPFLYDSDDGLGNNQHDYEAKVLIGKSLNEYGYLGAEVGYRLRNGAPSDEYRYLFEYGFSATKNLYFRAKLDGILSVENADTVVTENSDLSNPLEFDAGKLELTSGWSFDQGSALKGYGLEFTYTREIYGDNILKGNRFELGLTKVF